MSFSFPIFPQAHGFGGQGAFLNDVANKVRQNNADRTNTGGPNPIADAKDALRMKLRLADIGTNNVLRDAGSYDPEARVGSRSSSDDLPNG